MKKIKNKKISKIIIVILSAMLFVVGIPSIIYGATNESTLLLILGIIFVAFNFYGLPFFCISLANTCRDYKICLLITRNVCTNIKELAEHLNIKEKLATEYFKKCQSQELLMEYKLKENGNFVLSNKKIEKDPDDEDNKITVIHCINCGATVKITGKIGKCPYCKTDIKS